jgi:hypothetical protein
MRIVDFAIPIAGSVLASVGDVQRQSACDWLQYWRRRKITEEPFMTRAAPLFRGTLSSGQNRLCGTVFLNLLIAS